MENGRFKMHRLGKIMLSELEPSEQAEVIEKVGRLVGVPPAEWPNHGAQLISEEKRLYLVPVDDSLRAVVVVSEGDQPELRDIFRQEVLALFAKPSP